jgi:hypothetical protein
MLAGLWVWLATRIGAAFVSSIAWIGEHQGHSAGNLVYRWASQFDSAWFLRIAYQGYIRTPDERYAAFFPVYPALVRVVGSVTGKDWRAALIVSNLALLVLLVLLYRLAEQEMGAGVAGRTVFYLVAYPTGFFLTAAYNEGLFMAFLVGSLYCMRRGRWWSAGALGALAGGTRSAGLLLVLAFGYEYLRQHGRRLRLDALAVALIPLSLVTVVILDKIYFDDPLAFQHAQAQHWGRHVDWFWVPLYQATQSAAAPLRGGGFNELWMHQLLEAGTVWLLLVMLTLALVGPWRMRRDQLVFPLLGLALTIFMISFPSRFTKDIPYPLLSSSRIGLEVFPAFMMLGRLGRHPLIDRMLLAVFLSMQGILAARFLHGSWIA